MRPLIVDYTPALEQSAGIGRLVRHQVDALLRLNLPFPIQLFSGAVHRRHAGVSTAHHIRYAPLSTLNLQRLWYRLHLPLPIELFSGRFSLFHATDFVIPRALPDARIIVTIHDLSFVKVPHAASPALRQFLDRVVPYSLARAVHIIADSEATRRDVCETYNIHPHSISVVLSGVESRFRPSPHSDIRTRYGLGPHPFVVSVGTVQPRKNYARLVRALHALGSTYSDVQLVIAGGKGWLEDELYHTIDATGMSSRVHMIGFVDDADLPALYTEAIAGVFPSLYEGFGFPVLECMACGTPVITSNISSLPEVAGDACLLVNPYDDLQIRDTLRLLLEDSALRARLSHAGIQRSQRFTWERSAAQLLNVYRTVLNL